MEPTFEDLCFALSVIMPESVPRLKHNITTQVFGYEAPSLADAFVWEDTPEGAKYWSDLYDELIELGYEELFVESQ